jgi:hypothetical protein
MGLNFETLYGRNTIGFIGNYILARTRISKTKIARSIAMFTRTGYRESIIIRIYFLP